jgi:hypothetical protein
VNKEFMMMKEIKKQLTWKTESKTVGDYKQTIN